MNVRVLHTHALFSITNVIQGMLNNDKQEAQVDAPRCLVELFT